ncbi:uncharacterized protein EMH_0053660 [Eimeria mitis]|uniref:HMA domain-containing protein n=1 Tax=Eimeria mitis TaxID=44415 RepID=U6JWY8_9EIME|nr:uncharacterized protein EMH_0053660 [Eimeria mitis]CDJ29914.1 hypothetical protein EMH_0053660 [Eimeria mitis]
MPPVAVCELLVGGMTCAACTGAVQSSLIKCPGAIQAQVDLLRETARVAYNSDVISPAELCAAVESLGFHAQVLQIFVANNPSPSAESSIRTTTDSAEQSTDEQQEVSKELLVDGSAAGGCKEVELRLPQCQEATQQAHDFNELWAMSKATLRLALTERQGLSVESACSRLKSSNGVMGCVVTPQRGVEATGTKQLMVTYRPQKETVLGNQRAMLGSLLFSLIPALAVVCISVMARTDKLPPVFFFHQAALKGLRHGQFSMDLLVSLGSNLAFFYSALSCMQSAATRVWCKPLLSAADVAVATAAAAAAHPGATNPGNHTISPFYELLEGAEPQVFLDTCVMLICVVLLGKLLQLRAKARILEQLHRCVRDVSTCENADEADEAPDSGKPSCCCKQKKDLLEEEEEAAETPETQTTQRNDPEEITISAELLQAGDVVRVPPQEVLPADGILLAPSLLHVDERLLSGEGRGVCKVAGQRVIGGSRNASHTDAFVQIQVGDSSVLQTLLRLVETGQQQQQPLQKAAEKFATYFIPIVLCITAVAVVSWAVKVFAAAHTLPLSPLQQMRQRLHELELREGVSGSEMQQKLQQQHQQQQQHFETQGIFLTATGPARSTPISPPILGDTPVSAHEAAAAAAACRLSSWVLTWDSLLFALRFGVAVCCAACPCAIGLAAPAAVARGVFFKTGKALEAAANVNCLVVDKTGTLTTGELRVSACVVHTKRLEQLLLPALERSCSSLLASQAKAKPNTETCCSSRTAIGPSEGLKSAPCCCSNSNSSSSSSSSRSTRMSEHTPSPSDSVTSSLACESIVTLDSTAAAADAAAAPDDRLASPCCRKQPQGSSSSSSSNLEGPSGPPLAFCRLDFLYKASSPVSDENSSDRNSSSSSTNCCSSKGASSPQFSIWHSRKAGVYDGEALQGLSAASRRAQWAPPRLLQTGLPLQSLIPRLR